uniref:Uncharacterized protein n=1 Tax=Romanomermis culicivorax TaxID=13658 RepID=A0A915IU17_ROMCU
MNRVNAASMVKPDANERAKASVDAASGCTDIHYCQVERATATQIAFVFGDSYQNTDRPKIGQAIKIPANASKTKDNLAATLMVLNVVNLTINLAKCAQEMWMIPTCCVLSTHCIKGTRTMALPSVEITHGSSSDVISINAKTASAPIRQPNSRSKAVGAPPRCT